MLLIEVPETEFFDENAEEFVYVKGVTLRLEHSLISVSKWETKWRKPFLSRNAMTDEQTRDYIRCMTLNQQVDPKIYTALTPAMIEKVNEYINANLTATWFTEVENKPPSREVVTSELIYYWMCAYQIPWEAQKWHLSRLMTLIRIANIKNAPEKKMPKNAIMSRNRALNAARRAKHHTKG